MRSLHLPCVLLAAFTLASVLPPSAHAEDPETGVRLRVTVKVNGMGKVSGRNGEWVGTKGQGQPIDGFEVALEEPIPDLGIRYKFHVGNIGDTEWMTGFADFRGRYIQGVAIELTGAAATAYEVLYQTHLDYTGDTEAFRDGFFCGTRGEGRNVQCVVVVVKRKK